MIETDRLAIDGGRPVISEPLPSGVSGPSVMGEEEIAAVAEVIRSGRLFVYPRGESVTAEFEAAACRFLGVEHALMVNSGTSALTAGLIAVGVGPGDEVIIPGYTYVATAAAVLAAGAVPVIAEVDYSLGLDPADFERNITPQTRAVIPVHMRGIPVRLARILEIAEAHSITVVEDACQCVGGSYRGRPVGTYGKVAAWSLNYFKTISTGEGGLLYTNDRDIWERAALASDPGLPLWEGPEAWRNDAIPRATNRPSEILAAIALVQLGRLEQILAHQRSLRRALLGALEPPRGYVLQHLDDPDGDTGGSVAVIVRNQERAQAYARALSAEGVEAATTFNQGFPDRHIYAHWGSILEKRSPHRLGYPWGDPNYRGSVHYSRDMCPTTLDLLSRCIRFDLHMNLERDHAVLIAKALNKVDAALGG